MRKIVAILFILCFASLMLGQTNYYVSPSAGGQNDGSSWQNAWTSFSDINWSDLSGGDTLFIDGGGNSMTYTSTLDVGSHGSYSNYVVVSKGLDSGHNGEVIFETGSETGIKLSGATYTEVNGFTFRNITDSKIIRVQGTHHIRVKNCKLYVQDYSGIFALETDYLEVYDSYFESDQNIEEQTDCIAVGGPADSIFIKGNTIVQQNEAYGPHTDGIQFWGAEDAWISNNKCYLVNTKTTHAQIIYATGHSGKFIVYNNVVYISSPANSPLVACRLASSEIEDVYFTNNTIVSNSPLPKGPYVDVDASGDHGNLVSKNNIFVNSSSPNSIATFKDMQSYEIDYNLYFAFNTSTVVALNGSHETLPEMQSHGHDYNSHFIQPQFVNFDWNFSKDMNVFMNYDFRLIDTSPGIDHGSPISFYNEDIDGVQRPQGVAWDLGAYEYIDGTTGIGPGNRNTQPDNFELLQNYPNPFNPTTTIEFYLKEAGDVTITVFDILGNKITELVKAYLQSGNYSTSFVADNLVSGTYFYTMQIGDFVDTKKMIILK